MERLAVLSGHLVPQLQGVQRFVSQPLDSCLHADARCTMVEVCLHTKSRQGHGLVVAVCQSASCTFVRQGRLALRTGLV